MPRQSPYIIHLSDDERTKLTARARKYTSSYRDVIRARIILFAADGLPNDQIARRVGTSRQIVSKWRKRFFEMGMPGLDESLRRGRPARFSPQRRGGG